MKDKRAKTTMRHTPLGQQIEDSEALVVRKRNPTKVKKSQADEAEAVCAALSANEHTFLRHRHVILIPWQYIEAKLSSKILLGAREQQDAIDAVEEDDVEVPASKQKDQRKKVSL